MRKVSYLLLSAVVIFSACKESFKKVSDGSGTEYKVISGKGGKLVTNGSTIEMTMTIRYKDSVLYSSEDNNMPQFAPYDTAKIPSEYKEAFRNIHVGDSIVMRVSTDTLLKRGESAPFMKKGQYLTQSYKILNVYATQAEAEKARDSAVVKAQAAAKIKAAAAIEKEGKIITDYLAKNNIKATRSPEGTYVQIIQQGTGSMIDTSVVVLTKYTGKVLDSIKAFDSNTDPAFGHAEPLGVNMTNDPSLGNPTIKGWTDGLTLLSKGAKARFYVPSALGYGKQGMGDRIPPDAILIFDIEVTDVLDKVQGKAFADAQMKKMQEMQKRYIDSIRNAQPQMQPAPSK